MRWLLPLVAALLVIPNWHWAWLGPAALPLLWGMGFLALCLGIGTYLHLTDDRLPVWPVIAFFIPIIGIVNRC